MNFYAVLRCSFGLALSITLCAQQRPSPGAGAGSPTIPTNPNSPSTSNSPTFPGTRPNSLPGGSFPTRPLYLSGKVVMQDGTPPPDPVAIQINCRMTPRTVAYTDRKGNFSVDLNDRNNDIFADASEPSQGFSAPTNGGGQERSICPGDPNLTSATLQVELAGFSSDVINLGTRHALDNPDIGTILLRRRGNVEGLTISATSALAPKDAQKALEKGRADAAKQKWTDAEKEFQKAVTIYPKYAAAWLELGNIQRQRKDVDGARRSYAEALTADSKFVSPYLQLASMAAGEQKWQEVVDDTDRLLHLNPVDFPQAWAINATAYYYLGKKDEAEKSAREGISHDPAHRYPRMNYLLGVLLSQKQEFAQAAENIREYLKYAPNSPDADQIRKQLAEVEKAAAPQTEKAVGAQVENPATPRSQQ
ncbi:MAG TPA: tetratricopeptide repeat protein [Bryobacteraceae bacterium]|nr:tetratricopeptide repeat protein [Bryobacteraceae bacterium]